MLKIILQTILSKGTTAICNFLVVVLTAQYLGAFGRGEIALLVLGMAIISLFQAIVGGSVVTYLVPKYSFKKLFLTASWWSVGMAIFIAFLLDVSYLINGDFLFELIIISILQGLISVCQNLLLGKENIQANNLIEIIKSVILLVFISLEFIFWKQPTLDVVLLGYEIAFGSALIVGLFFIRKYLFETEITYLKSHPFIPMLSTGFSMQINGLAQLFNYRFCFYLIEKWKGKEALGVFSVTISLAETIWIISKSIATYQYTKVVNSSNPSEQVSLTLFFSKWSTLLTIPATVVVVLIPNDFYSWLFGRDFSEIKPVLLSLSIGIVSFSFCTIINHYFSGTGKNRLNTYSSLIGNAITLGLGYYLIPIYGEIGAGITTSVVYLVMTFSLMYYFFRNIKLNHTQI